MHIYLLDTDLSLITVIDDYSSFIIRRKYHTAGNFELHIRLSSIDLKEFKKDRFILMQGEDEPGIIRTIELKKEDGATMVSISGPLAAGVIGQRINYGSINKREYVSEIIRGYLMDNLVYPSDQDRMVHRLYIGQFETIPNKILYQKTGGNILDEFEKLSKTYDFGFNITADLKSRELLFNLYQGKDRTVGNKYNNPHLVFSDNYNNVLSSNYILDNNHMNAALVAGAGEGEDRIKVEVGGGNGLDRHELYVDARDLQQKTSDDEPALTDSEYRELLANRGEEKLAEFPVVESLEGKINADVESDYELGDKVTYKVNEWGLQLNTYIAEIERVYEEEGITENVIFGNDLPTIIEKIRREE